MLFETDDGVRLCVFVKYQNSDCHLKEMNLSNGQNIFVAEPDREFEVLVSSVGPCEDNLYVDCFVGEPQLPQ